jgi:hypothetical protein
VVVEFEIGGSTDVGVDDVLEVVGLLPSEGRMGAADHRKNTQ